MSQVAASPANSSKPKRRTITASRTRLLSGFRPPRTPSMRWITSRVEANSDVENSTRMAVPTSPVTLRVRTIRSKARVSSPLYTGKFRVSWPTTSSAACSVDSTNPTSDTPRRTSGIRQIRKTKASPAERKKPSWEKKREKAPRRPPNTDGPSEQAAHEPAVHLDRHAGHVRRALRGQEDQDVGEFLRRADASQGDVRAGSGHIGVGGHAGLLGPAQEAIGHDSARADDVDGDVVRAQLGRQCLGQPGGARSHRVRQQKALHRLLDRHRLDGQDAAPLPLAHGREHFADQANHREERDLEGPVPLLIG